MTADTVTRLYCRACGYVHPENGVMRPQCPQCKARMWFVRGTPDEVQEFADAMAKDPEAYRRFPGGF